MPVLCISNTHVWKAFLSRLAATWSVSHCVCPSGCLSVEYTPPPKMTSGQVRQFEATFCFVCFKKFKFLFSKQIFTFQNVTFLAFLDVSCCSEHWTFFCPKFFPLYKNKLVYLPPVLHPVKGEATRNTILPSILIFVWKMPIHFFAQKLYFRIALSSSNAG